ncbi:MFS transporter [Amycolatopsis sacchari]|uniref:MFS transporter n=1 Tax=Amycolatopsis sacchari TaxID=115433 RepID=UPI003D736166
MAGRVRLLLAGPVGACLANYDFGIYGTLSALVFGKVFFPSLSPVAGTLASFGTFAAGFVAKPAGALLFGRIGDRFGRRTVVVSALVLMGTATLAIGALPTFAVAGVAAPVLLTALRLVQGLAVGGEWGGAAAFAVEHAPDRRRGLWGGAVGAGGPVGSILAALTVLPLSTVLSPQQFLTWGWRIPFLVSALFVLAGLWIRLGAAESPVFRAEVADRARLRLREVFRANGKEMLLVFCLAAVPTTGVYLMNTYALAYGVSHAGLARSAMLGYTTVAQVLALVIAAGLLTVADRIGVLRLLAGSVVLMIASGWVLFAALDTGRTAVILTAATIGQVAVNGMVVASVPLYVLLFPPRARVTGAGFSFKVSDAVLGGTAPLIAGLLLSATGGGSWSVSAWVSLLGVLSLAACFAGRARFRRATSQVAPVPQPVLEGRSA